MLSILACYSMFAIIPLYVCLACFEQGDLLSKRRPKYRPKLWVIVILVILLAIDFAVSVTVRRNHTPARPDRRRPAVAMSRGLGIGSCTRPTAAYTAGM
jgi:hypothetical protein